MVGATGEGRKLAVHQIPVGSTSSRKRRGPCIAASASLSSLDSSSSGSAASSGNSADSPSTACRVTSCLSARIAVPASAPSGSASDRRGERSLRGDFGTASRKVSRPTRSGLLKCRRGGIRLPESGYAFATTRCSSESDRRSILFVAGRADSAVPSDVPRLAARSLSRLCLFVGGAWRASFNQGIGSGWLQLVPWGPAEKVFGVGGSHKGSSGLWARIPTLWQPGSVPSGSDSAGPVNAILGLSSMASGLKGLTAVCAFDGGHAGAILGGGVTSGNRPIGACGCAHTILRVPLARFGAVPTDPKATAASSSSALTCAARRASGGRWYAPGACILTGGVSPSHNSTNGGGLFAARKRPVSSTGVSWNSSSATWRSTFAGGTPLYLFICCSLGAEARSAVAFTCGGGTGGARATSTAGAPFGSLCLSG